MNAENKRFQDNPYTGDVTEAALSGDGGVGPEDDLRLVKSEVADYAYPKTELSAEVRARAAEVMEEVNRAEQEKSEAKIRRGLSASAVTGMNVNPLSFEGFKKGAFGVEDIDDAPRIDAIERWG